MIESVSELYMVASAMPDFVQWILAAVGAALTAFMVHRYLGLPDSIRDKPPQ